MIINGISKVTYYYLGVYLYIKIVVALEGEFDFEFDDEMLLITAFPTIKSIIDYVESKVHDA